MYAGKDVIDAQGKIKYVYLCPCRCLALAQTTIWWPEPLHVSELLMILSQKYGSAIAWYLVDFIKIILVNIS